MKDKRDLEVPLVQIHSYFKPHSTPPVTWLSDLDFNIFSDEVLTSLQDNLSHNWTDFDEQGLPSIDSKFPSCSFWLLEQR